MEYMLCQLSNYMLLLALWLEKMMERLKIVFLAAQ